MRIGPGFCMGDGNLPAIGKAGFQPGARLPIDDHDFVPCASEKPGAGNTDHAGTKNGNPQLMDSIIPRGLVRYGPLPEYGAGCA